MTGLTRVRTREQIADVVLLGRDIWTEHYVPIIGQEQVHYMLDKFQSEQAIAEQLAAGYEYYTVSHDDKIVGYMAVVPDEDTGTGTGTAMISKIYVRKSVRGHGLGRAMLAFAEDLCRERRLRTLWLTVNKHNRQALAWYRRMGFRNLGSTVQDIGGGFVMDDYRMEKTVSPQSPANGAGKSASSPCARPNKP